MREIKARRGIPIGLIALISLVVAIDLNPARTEDEFPDYECCTETELVYKNGDVQLAGVLLSPLDDGQFPAAVILQGSGDSDRSNVWARLVAETMVSKGVAVLLTDKRGSGQSGGNWRTSSFGDLAEDALAGVEAVRGIEGVKRGNVGLIGLSQGGIVAPLAASMGDVQFVINIVGGATSMKDTLFHELEQTYRQYGLGDSQIEELQRLTSASFAYMETGQGFETYLDCRNEIEQKFGHEAVANWPSTREDDYWVMWGSIYDFDPIPYLRETVDIRRLPAFIAYGELDEADNVAVKASVHRLETELDGRSLNVQVYPDTGHSLMNEALRSEGQYVFVQGLIDDLGAWIDSNL